MGNWVTSLGITEVAEGLICCTTSTLSAICSKCTVSHSRFLFSLFLVFGTIASFSVLSPNMRQLLDKIPYFCTAVTTNEMCDNLVGYGAVYRICLSLGVFYIIFGLLMFNTTSTNDFRFKLHNGYWLLKLVLLVMILVAAFHIPRHAQFGRLWMYAGLTGGFMFIMLQILLVIDFAHSWGMSWAEKVDSGNSCFWYTALAVSTILIYSVAITMAVLFYLFFTDLRNLSKCRGNLFLITFNLSHCMLASFISVLPRVQDEALGSGLLQSSVITLYAMYLTWCTLSSEPDSSCNPLGDVILEYDKASGINGQALFDCVLMFALLIFACNVRSDTSKLEKLGFSMSKMTVAKKYNYIDTFEEASKKGRDKNFEDDEFVEYNYSFFHFVMFLASLQLMMVVTNWHSPDELADMKKMVKNWASVWIQLSSSFVCVLFYIWAIVAPLLVRTWGPCLGLDYDSVPTECDDEYWRFQRHKDAMCVRDEVLEEFKSRKNLTIADKSRQSTKDSGMFDTNASRSHSRSVSRASVRPSSCKSIHPELNGAKMLESLEDTAGTVLEIESASLDQKYENKQLRRTNLEQLQSRQSAVNTSCKNASLPNVTQCHLTNIDGVSEKGKSLMVSSRTGGRISALKTHHIISDICGKENTVSRPSSRVVVDDRTLSSDEGNRTSKRAGRTRGAFSVISSDEDHESSKAASRSNSTDLSLSSDEMIGNSRESSPMEKNYSKSQLSKIAGSEKPISPGRMQQSEQPTPCTKANETYRSRSPEKEDSAQPTSRLVGSIRPITLGEMDIHSRPGSWTIVTDQPNSSEPSDENAKYSSRGLGNDWTGSSVEIMEHQRPLPRPVDNSRAQTSDKGRTSILQMSQHIEWFKRLRKSRKASSAANTKNSFENKRQLDKSNIQTVKLSSHNNEETKSGNSKAIKSTENDFEIVSKVSLETQPSHENLSSFGRAMESSEIINSVDEENETKHKKEDSAIFLHPFISEQFPSSSITRPQAPDVSKEILRLQAKILRFQAKVVKSQQKILQMQEQDYDPRTIPESQKKNSL